jgi:hypothetical protein
MLAALVVRDNVRFRKRIEYFYRYCHQQAQREILIANAYFVPGVAADGAAEGRQTRRSHHAAAAGALRGTSCSTTRAGRCTARMLDAGHRDHRVRAELPACQGRRSSTTARRDRHRRLVEPRSISLLLATRGQT